MVRAPCCEKVGVKKGPWSVEEDRILVSYIQENGHGNWRSLPKQAGLLRCGKSCRLRWINYLRPDIKRGNFTSEEEETIIRLHEQLGNKWSAIAAKLPGRTDNEIKNVWHTHLKKQLKSNTEATDIKDRSSDMPKHKSKTKRKPDDSYLEVSNNSWNFEISLSHSCLEAEPSIESLIYMNQNHMKFGNTVEPIPVSPSHSSSNLSHSISHSSILTNENVSMFMENEWNNSSGDTFVEMDETFWNEALSMDSTIASEDGTEPNVAETRPEITFSPGLSNDQSSDDCMDLWLNVYLGTQDLPELLQGF